MEEDYFYCADPMCDGHTFSGQRCPDPFDNPVDPPE